MLENKELSFQWAEAIDIEPIFEFNKALIDKYEDIKNIDYHKVLQWVHRKIEGNIKEYTTIMLHEQKVGYYYFHKADGKMGLDDFFILPQHRNQGIGTAVLNKCILQTDLPIFLYVFSKNTKAIFLYSRMGFKIIENIKDARYIMQRD